jgi:hypothetical protein
VVTDSQESLNAEVPPEQAIAVWEEFMQPEGWLPKGQSWLSMKRALWTVLRLAKQQFVRQQLEDLRAAKISP